MGQELLFCQYRKQKQRLKREDGGGECKGDECGLNGHEFAQCWTWS